MRKYLVIFSVLFTALLLTNLPKAHAAFIDKDCKDFSSTQQLMDFWYSNGYSATYDPHGLDRDNDGLPCEVTSGDYSSYVASKSSSHSTTTTTTTTTSTGWKQVNGKWYYYDRANVKHTGWLSNNGAWYYMDSNGVMKTGWVKVSTKWYFFNSNGTMKTGWLLSSNKWYYLASDGSMATGWKNVSGSWYYFDGTGTMKTGWLSLSGKWYYLKSSGAMQTGWGYVANQWYFFDSSGAMKTGWVKDGSNWYYLNSNGTMKTGWLQSGDKWYYLQKNGVMAADMNVDGYWFDENGVWIQYPEQGFVEKVTTISQTYGIQAVQVNRSEFSLQVDGVEVGYVIENGVVYLDKAYKACAIDLARSMQSPPPVTDEELSSLVDEALTSGSAYTDEVAVEMDEDYLGIYWNAYY